MAAPNRNQHWVPQFYLKYFATPETRDTKCPQIWAFPIDEGEEFKTRPRNVAAQRDLYAYCTPSVDQKLTDLEGTLSRLWPKIAYDHYPLDETFRKALSLFIATLYLRHPAELERHRRWRDAWAKIVPGAPKDAQGRVNINSVRYNDEVFEVKPGEPEGWARMSEEEVAESWGEQILLTASTIATSLMTLPWSVIFTDEPAFITTDHPVAISHVEHHRPAILAPGALIHFPISPTRILVIGERRLQDGRVHRVLPQGISTQNFLIFRSAYKHVFSAWDPIHVCAEVCEAADQAREDEVRKMRLSAPRTARVGRNEKCPCGSGEKYKRCCGA